MHSFAFAPRKGRNFGHVQALSSTLRRTLGIFPVLLRTQSADLTYSWSRPKFLGSGAEARVESRGTRAHGYE